MTITHHTVQCLNAQGFHNMHYTAWGQSDNPNIVMCIHGLTRNGRDFDTLAHSLANDFQVICPDIVGRGQSDWLPNKHYYGMPQYMADINTLLAKLSAKIPRCVHWVGTSMGGMIGMVMASLPQTPIQSIVINDVGTHIDKIALERIARYVGLTPTFASYAEINLYMRAICRPFGPLNDAQWDHLTKHNVKQNTQGLWTLNYDPGIAQPFQDSVIAEVDLSSFYEKISCRALLLRGKDSDLLSHATAHRMTQTGPKAQLIEFDGVGHAPMLMTEDQISSVQKFLHPYKQ